MLSVVSEFDDFADVLQTERDVRSLFIVGSARVDRLLFEILSAYLMPKASKNKEEDELLEGEKCPFSVRIKMCARLGLIDQTLYKDLERLRQLRNRCAHLVEFNHAEAPIKDFLTDLRRSVAGRKSYVLVEKRFLGGVTPNLIEEYQCVLLTLCALLEAVRNATTQTIGNDIAIKVSAR